MASRRGVSQATTRINVDKLAQQIADELSQFTTEIVEQIDISGARIGKKAVKKLKATSPKKSGRYKKSWMMTTDKVIGLPNKYTLHVRAPRYRLTHLLEKGHVIAGGTGRVKAYPHIGPVEEEVIEQFTREVEEAIKRG